MSTISDTTMNFGPFHYHRREALPMVPAPLCDIDNLEQQLRDARAKWESMPLSERSAPVMAVTHGMLDALERVAVVLRAAFIDCMRKD